MSAVQNDYEDDFEDTALDDSYELDFNDSKVLKKRNRAETRRQTRRRLEDHFERKALKETEDNWDYDLDFDY